MKAAQAIAVLALAAALAGCVTSNDGLMDEARAAARTPVGTAPAPVDRARTADPLDRGAPDPMRWLYGSGEAAAVSIQAYRALADYAVRMAATRPSVSVVMGLPGVDGGAGSVTCRNSDGSAKPPAVVFDADETAILNRGFEYWTALGHGYDADAWADWAANGAPYVAPVPGAVTGMRRLRDAGIAVVFNTNRDARDAAGTAAALEAAGVGPAIHGETLFLKGDDAMGGRKDGRRATIAARFCVLALAGDNLGDFADVFNTGDLAPQARRQLAGRGAFAQLWGNGWFALPNPVYGDAIRGSIGEVFPPDARWSPPSGTASAE